ncbi:MAG TPA: hypothetical protein VM076_17210 [Gemmatimonadaceae bacterium]|nr:hypothetical protein [Gemmatimonadaceae bacterium]
MISRARIVIPAARAFVVMFGVMALWLARDGLNADGIAYLDASDVFLSGRWPASGSGYWSPLYPTLLALARLVGGTAPARELAIAHAVNLVAFLLAYGALELMLFSARRATPTREAGAEPNDITWALVAYGVFAIATIAWIRMWILTPDMLVASAMFAAAAFTIRIAHGNGRWGSAIALGTILGLGYLTKAALLPIGVVVLATLAFVARRRGAIPLTAAAALLFAAISARQIAYVSALKGSPTFSDVGRLSHLWFIADVPGPVSSAFPLPARLPSPTGTAQTLLTLGTGDPHPAVYDIDAPIPGTLPIWYDAGYWYRGVVAPLRPFAIARAVVRHARVYLELFGLLIAGGLAAAFAGPVSRRAVLSMRPEPLLVVPAIAGLAMYALVLVQDRYVAPFALLLLAGLVPPWAVDELSRRIRAGFATSAIVSLPLVAHQMRVDTTYWRGSAQMRTNVVSALATRGIPSGARLGFIGDAYDALWAREGRFRFVTLLPRAESSRFWDLPSAEQGRVLAHMREQGAAAIVAEAPALGVNTAGWETLPSAGVPKAELMVHRFIP